MISCLFVRRSRLQVNVEEPTFFQARSMIARNVGLMWPVNNVLHQQAAIKFLQYLLDDSFSSKLSYCSLDTEASPARQNLRPKLVSHFAFIMNR